MRYPNQSADPAGTKASGHLYSKCYLSNNYLEIPRRSLAPKCYAKHERPTFTLKTGTIFEDSPIALEKQLPAVRLIVTCKNGISSYKIARDLGSLRNPLGTWRIEFGSRCTC